MAMAQWLKQMKRRDEEFFVGIVTMSNIHNRGEKMWPENYFNDLQNQYNNGYGAQAQFDSEAYLRHLGQSYLQQADNVKREKERKASAAAAAEAKRLADEKAKKDIIPAVGTLWTYSGYAFTVVERPKGDNAYRPNRLWVLRTPLGGGKLEHLQTWGETKFSKLTSDYINPVTKGEPNKDADVDWLYAAFGRLAVYAATFKRKG